METTGTGADWLKLLGQIIAIAGGIAGLVAFFLRYANPADKVERWVDEDCEYRSELAKELKGGRPGSLYKETLERGLDWLDRKFGPANSAKALGVCIIIALYYGYAAFLLAWGIGGPGDVGGVLLLSESVEWSIRLLSALILAAILPIAFLFGRWLGELERRLKLRLA
jgi:hypothetical protein